VYGSYEDVKGVYMAMGLCSGGEVFDKLYKDHMVFDEEMVIAIMPTKL
jgi:hypothetical protein